MATVGRERAPPAPMEVTQPSLLCCSRSLAASGGSSEFPTGNELQPRAESGPRVWAPSFPCVP